jgi:two-component system alkaline phosphatase synthesis response regulator PhoP
MAGKKRVLVVDDEPDFVAVVKRNLEEAGFLVEEAYDGNTGLDKVRDHPPDAIVLDVMMPDKDGYAVCAELKATEKYADIPIILLTAVASHVPSTRYSHYDGMTMDADDYLPKPASAEQIIASLKKLLKL